MRGRARRGARSHNQTAPRHRIAPAFPIQTPFPVQTLFLVQIANHRPCCPCPAHVPHMSPPVPLVSLSIVLHAPLCLMAPISAISVIILVLLAVAIGSRPLHPSPPVVRRVESSLLLGHGRSLRPRLPGGGAPLAPMRGSRHIVQTGP